MANGCQQKIIAGNGGQLRLGRYEPVLEPSAEYSIAC